MNIISQTSPTVTNAAQRAVAAHAAKVEKTFRADIAAIIKKLEAAGKLERKAAGSIFERVVEARLEGLTKAVCDSAFQTDKDSADAPLKKTNIPGMFWLNNPATGSSFRDSVGIYSGSLTLAIAHKIELYPAGELISVQSLNTAVAPFRASHSEAANKKRAGKKAAKEAAEAAVKEASESEGAENSGNVVNVGDALAYLLANPTDENIGAHQTALRKLAELVAAYDKARAMPPADAAPKALTKAQVRELGKLARLEAARMAEAA